MKLYVDLQSVLSYVGDQFNLSPDRARVYVDELIAEAQRVLGGVEGIYTTTDLVVRGEALLSADHKARATVLLIPSPHPGELILKRRKVADETPAPCVLTCLTASAQLVPTTEYRLVRNLSEVLQYLGPAETIGVDTETTGLKPFAHELMGVSMSAAPGTGIYIPSDCFHLPDLQDILKTRNLVFHNAPFDALFLGLDLRGYEYDDTKLMAFLLGFYKADNGLKSLARQHLGLEMKEWTEVFSHSLESLAPYACMDADATRRLFLEVLSPQMQETGLLQRYAGIELPMCSILTNMERRGILIDTDFVQAEIEGLLRVRDRLVAKFPCNPDSPKQLSRLFYEDRGHPCRHYTPGGDQSVNKAALLYLVERGDPLAVLLRDIRDVDAAVDDYMQMIINLYPDHRMHPEWRQTWVITGRLSSSPNTQNIIKIYRLAIIAPDGMALLSADANQLEMRVMAGLSGEPYLISAFENDEDIHTSTARLLFEVDEPTEEQRFKGKTGNFATLYGAGKTKVDPKVMAILRRKMPLLARWQAEQERLLLTNDYVETWLGHRMYRQPTVDPTELSHQRKEARNWPIQGTASSDIIKTATIRLDRTVTELGAFLTNQVHDELVYETPHSGIADLTAAIHEVFRGVGFPVPITAKVKVGQSWG